MIEIEKIVPFIKSSSAGELVARVLVGTYDTLMGPVRPKLFLKDSLRNELRAVVPESLSVVSEAEQRSIRNAQYAAELTGDCISVCCWLGLIPYLYHHITPVFSDTNLVASIDNVVIRGFAAIVLAGSITLLPNRAIKEVVYALTSSFQQKRLNADLHNWAKSEGFSYPSISSVR